MKTLSDIKQKIEEIRNSDFKIEDFNDCSKNHKFCRLLRKALLCRNSICYIDNISEEESEELYKELDEVMKNKFKELNPNFSEEVLINMTNTYYRGDIVYPMDIFVIDDAVFHKEGIYDDYGYIYEIETFMYDDMKPYYNALSMYFIFDETDWLLSPKLFSEEDEIYISKFISNSINSICKKNITISTYEFNNGSGRSKGLSKGEIRGVNIYINMNFENIARSIKKQNECDIKLCVQNGDDISIYYIHQSFNDNKPVWNVVKTDSKVWRLTEEVSKLNNTEKSTPLVKKLVPTKKDN